jgi:hypothetical protein
MANSTNIVDNTPISNPQSSLDRAIELVRSIYAVKATEGTSLNTRIDRLSGLITELREFLCDEIAQAVNSAHPDKDHRVIDKRTLADSLNDLLDGMGLRIKCPKTGRGAVLIGAIRGDGSDKGRFEIRATGRGANRTYSPSFPQIEIILKDMETRRRPGRAIGD